MENVWRITSRRLNMRFPDLDFLRDIAVLFCTSIILALDCFRAATCIFHRRLSSSRDEGDIAVTVCRCGDIAAKIPSAAVEV